jgi:hypothetical protein
VLRLLPRLRGCGDGGGALRWAFTGSDGRGRKFGEEREPVMTQPAPITGQIGICHLARDLQIGRFVVESDEKGAWFLPGHLTRRQHFTEDQAE